MFLAYQAIFQVALLYVCSARLPDSMISDDTFASILHVLDDQLVRPAIGTESKLGLGDLA